MLRLILRLALSAVALLLTSLALNALGDALSPQVAQVSHLKDLNHPDYVAHMTIGPAAQAVLAVLLLSIVNAVVRPIVRLLSLPLNLATLGMFGIIVNALLFWAVGYFTHGYEVRGVLGCLLGPILMGILSGVLNLVVKDRRRRRRDNGSGRQANPQDEYDEYDA